MVLAGGRIIKCQISISSDKVPSRFLVDLAEGDRFGLSIWFTLSGPSDFDETWLMEDGEGVALDLISDLHRQLREERELAQCIVLVVAARILRLTLAISVQECQGFRDSRRLEDLALLQDIRGRPYLETLTP
jgi:hypothetical protein